MKKIVWLTVLVSLLLMTMSGMIMAQDIVVLRLGHVTAPTHPYQTASEKLAELVAEKTDGSLEIRAYPAGQLGGERDLLEGLQMGTIDIAISSLGVAASFIPEVNLFNLPFIFNDADHYNEVVHGPHGQAILEQAKNRNMVGLGFFAPVFRVPMNNERPIESPDDFRGLRIRLMEVPLHMDTYRALGSSTVPLPFGELYTALQLGTVDGNENAIATLYTERFYEVQDYLTILPVFSNGAVFLMSKVVWDGLSPEHQEAIMESMPGAIEQGDKDYLALDEKGLQVMEEAGLGINQPEDLDPFRAAVESVYDRYLGRLPEWVQEAFEDIVE